MFAQNGSSALLTRQDSINRVDAMPVQMFRFLLDDETKNIDHPFEPIEAAPEAQVVGIGFG